MSRSVWFWVCAILGLVMIFFGWLVPMHLRAIDESVIEQAGRNTRTLVKQALVMVAEKKLGAAQLLLQAAQAEGVPGRETLRQATTNVARLHPALQAWGGPEPRLESSTDPRPSNSASEPFTDFVIRLDHRQRVFDVLEASRQPVVRQLLRTRDLTNTMVFPPSRSSAGQAFDAALCITGLLAEQGHFSPALSNAVFAAASEANAGTPPDHLEDIFVNLMSLGQRFNWGQLVAFLQPVQTTDTLRQMAHLVRTSENQLPILFSAVQLSGQPAPVARYLAQFSQTGLNDLGQSLRYGQGGVRELLKRNQRLHRSLYTRQFAHLSPFSSLAEFTWAAPWPALASKWLLYLLGGFLLAMAAHFALPKITPLEAPLQVRGFHIAREVLFALGFLLVLLLLTEPFLSLESQKVDFPFKLRLPMTGNALNFAKQNTHSQLMNQLSLLTLLLFFVLQSLLYTASLFKLAEIRRQRVPARLKLRLLDNEDHLFDAGLYLGFVGTIISLILVSLGVIKPSLMAAYSSTSFGIIFVSIFKILNLRPVRRKLVLEAEATTVETPAPAPRATLVSPT